MIQLSHLVDHEGQPAAPGAAYRCKHDDRTDNQRKRRKPQRRDTANDRTG